MTVTDELALLRARNPVPDPAGAVDPAERARALARAVTAPPRRRRVLSWRRAVLGVTATAAAAAALLLAGEQRSAPPQFAVLPALASDLSRNGVLHTLERTVQLSRDGKPHGAVHVEESWTLLDDPTVSRWRIGTGADVEEGASGPDGPAAAAVEELPVERLARAAAAGTVPAEPGPTINGRATVKIPTDDGAWYIARDEPVLVRRVLQFRDGTGQRSDFVVFEVLPGTAANRALVQGP